MTASVLVIGIGNEWRGDDAVGPFVVKALQPHCPPHVRALPCIADGLDLLNAWSAGDIVYVIDALHSGRAPGTVLRVDALAQALPTEAGYSSHSFGLAEAIELGRTLGNLPHKLIVIGIEGGAFAMGSGLSATVADAAQGVIAALRAELHCS